MARNKVTVIGAGNVGATTAQRIAEAGLADVVLVDIVEGLPQGKGLDLAEAAPVVGHDARITGTNDYADTAGSDIVVVTSGLARQPGMSRDDLLAKNAGHRPRRSSSRPRQHSPDAILIIVTNPLDAMCHVALQASGFPRERVLGMAGVLDSAPVPDVHRPGARRLASRTPTPSCSAATATRWSRCRATRPSPACRSPSCCRPSGSRRSRSGRPTAAPRSSRCSRPGSAFYAPAASTFEMVESIPARPEARSSVVAVLLDGEFGTTGLVVGVPIVLGAAGMERVFEINLTADEQAAFDASAAASQGSSKLGWHGPHGSAGGPGGFDTLHVRADRRHRLRLRPLRAALRRPHGPLGVPSP